MNLRAIILATTLVAFPVSGADYLRDIKPVLKARCFECHGGLKQKEGLRLDTAANILKGGIEKKVVIPGDPAGSLLLEKITAKNHEERMPPEGEPLKPEQVVAIREWIAAGAPIPKDEEAQADPREHWSFQPITRPALPTLNPKPASLNPIDKFLEAKRREHNLQPNPPAPAATQLRRVYLDLIGLPPTREQLIAFQKAAARNPNSAFEKVVDELLASPRHGERWGRHWMDIWRYSDWYGRRPSNEIRYSQRHIWRWRDWIIESVNADKGYNRMLTEMLAADEVAPADLDALRATGYLGRNWYKFDRNTWLFETVERTGEGLLGLTFRCARCHDHKFDPVTQKEYYQFRAFFEPHGFRTDALAAGIGTETDNGKSQVLKEGLSRAFDAEPTRATYLFRRGDDRQPQKDNPLSPAVPQAFGNVPFDIRPVDLPVASWYPALNPTFIQSSLNAAGQLIGKAEASLKEAKSAEAAVRKALAEFDAGKGQPTSAENLWLADDFKRRREDTWKAVSGEWAYEKDRLTLKRVGTFQAMMTRATHPRDFRARVRYITREPGRYHSVGVFFDAVESREAQAVYTSTTDKSSAVQAFHRTGGKEVYPQAGIVKRPIKLNEEITLDLAVRGNQLNVWVNGRLDIAYKLPLARRDGKFALWVHSGVAEFLEVQVDKLPDEFALAKAKPSQLGSPFGKPTKESFERAVVDAEKATAIAKMELQLARLEHESLTARVAAERAKFKQPDTALAQAAAKAEREAALAKARLAVRKAADAKQRAAADKALKTAEANLKKTDSKYTPLGKSFPKQSTGRRTALARWLTDRRNPRTARVAVNHIWARHFGKPLVATPANFGLAGQSPTHPELLDWLAAELMENGWRMKHIHKLIVTSAAYRQSAIGTPSSDRDNRFLSRMNSRRMEAELVRDSMLAAARELDLTMGGPELADNLGQTSRRRSIYFRTTPDNQVQMLALFDLANPNECYERRESVMPQQSLALLNSALALDLSRLLARKLTPEAKSPEDFVAAVFEWVLSRQPSKEEMAASVKFLQTQPARLAKPGIAFTGANPAKVAPAKDLTQRARENFVQVLFNHNDFVTIR